MSISEIFGAAAPQLVQRVTFRSQVTPEYTTGNAIQLSFGVAVGGGPSAAKVSPEAGMGVAVAKFMVAFSGKHYGAVQRQLPNVLANKAPGTSVAEKSGDFLSAIRDERQQQLNKLIEIFG